MQARCDVCEVPAGGDHAHLGSGGKRTHIDHPRSLIERFLGGDKPGFAGPLAAPVAHRAGGRLDNHGRGQARQGQAEEQRDLYVGVVEGSAAQGALQQLGLASMLQQRCEARVGEGSQRYGF